MICNTLKTSWRLLAMSEPEAMDPKVWLWICGEKDVEVDLA